METNPIENEKLSHLNSLTPIEVADILNEADENRQKELFKQLSLPLAVNVFEYLPFKVQKSLSVLLEPQKVTVILREMSPDDRTAFLERLPPHVVSDLLKLLPLQDRIEALGLLKYPEGSIGRLMTPDFIAVKLNWTVQETLDYIRKKGMHSETINIIYVIDDEGKLIDDIRIREFLLAPLDCKVADLSDKKFVSLTVTDKDEDAIKVFLRNNYVALPVVDDMGILKGIVTVDDVLNLVTQVDTEDIQKIGGTEALEHPYMQTSFFDLMGKRINWLLILFIGELFTASAMGFFENEISKAVVLALFLPLIISSGGNSGSQASTLIIRALAIGEVTLKDWWRIIRREIFAGLFLGTILGCVGFLRVSLWSAFSNIYGPHWMLVALTVFFSLIGVVLWGTFSGAMLPLILKKFGFDPAVSSAPFVATMVDVTGIVIYFVTASIIMRGTLL